LPLISNASIQKKLQLIQTFNPRRKAMDDGAAIVATSLKIEHYNG
jgi:hypothetical protein